MKKRISIKLQFRFVSLNVICHVFFMAVLTASTVIKRERASLISTMPEAPSGIDQYCVFHS